MTANSAIERQEVVGADGGELPVRTAKWGAGRFGFVAIAALAGPDGIQYRRGGRQRRAGVAVLRSCHVK